MFELGVYAKVGQHCGAGMYADRRDMGKHVRKLLTAEPDLLMIEAVEYSRYCIATQQTIIYHMTQDYLDHVESISRHAFADRAAYHQYMAAAHKCLRTGKAVSFKYC
jgi:hypothetical protein